MVLYVPPFVEINSYRGRWSDVRCPSASTLPVPDQQELLDLIQVSAPNVDVEGGGKESSESVDPVSAALAQLQDV